MDIKQYSC